MEQHKRVSNQRIYFMLNGNVAGFGVVNTPCNPLRALDVGVTDMMGELHQ